jgi:alpha-glucosidase
MSLPEWTAGIHHDGSKAFVSNPLPALGETVVLTLRVPKEAPILSAFIRSTPDGEGHHVPMIRVREDALSGYWQGELRASMPRNNYRFKLLMSDGAMYVNQHGVSRVDGPDWGDFTILADFEAPDWVHESVFYQIFPDRFANGDPSLTPKDGDWEADGASVVQMEWDDLPRPWKESGSVDFFGGDLPGVIEHLDYVEALGVTALYFTPVFPSYSYHRYNIHDFYSVDPHLGGDQALIDLRQALDARGMRLMLDVTHNHTGNKHAWFTEAQADENAPSADYYTFNARPDDYVAWLGVKTLPKLNYRSEKLREQMYAGENSVLRYWLREPFRIDAWRLDVANMAGRQGESQLGHKVGRGMRQAVKLENPQAYLIGEHFFDGTQHLQGDEFDAIMDYQGLNIPLWRWLSGYDAGSWAPGSKDTVPMETAVFAEHINRYRGAVPWVIANQQFHQLCSHDTIRILNICGGDKGLVRVGLAMLMLYPGVPCVYYGDEIGMAGDADPDNRRPMPWDSSKWDMAHLAHYRTWIAARKASHALKYGGYQQLYAGGDVMAFQRQSDQQRMVCIAHRGTLPMNGFRLDVRAAGIVDGSTLTDAISGQIVVVHEGGVTLDLPAYGVFAFEVA